MNGSDEGLSGLAARAPTVPVITRAAIEISDAANQSALRRLPDGWRCLLMRVTYPHDAGVLLFASRLSAPKAILVPIERGRDEDENISCDNGVSGDYRQDGLSMTSESEL